MAMSRNQYVDFSWGHLRHKIYRHDDVNKFLSHENQKLECPTNWMVSYTLFMSSIIFFFQFFEKFWSYTSVKIKHSQKQHHWCQWKHDHPLFMFSKDLQCCSPWRIHGAWCTQMQLEIMQLSCFLYQIWNISHGAAIIAIFSNRHSNVFDFSFCPWGRLTPFRVYIVLVLTLRPLR